MTEPLQSEDKPTWTGFFGGCLLILLVATGIGFTFHYFAQKQAAQIQQVEDLVFTPYWQAVRQSDFKKALEFRSQDWKKNNTQEKLADAYQKATKEHGALTKAYVKTANRFYQPGMEHQAMRVETIVEFEDGWLGGLNYNIVRATDQDAWKIDQSFTRATFPLGKGPY